MLPTERAQAVFKLKDFVRLRVSANVWFLGVTSLLTDVSSEMIVSILPAYLVLQLGLTPLAFGAIDSIYQGLAGLTRILGGFVGDRTRRYKAVAAFGYGLSAVSRTVLLFTTSGAAVGTAVATDRIGKGIRTAPRDALIALSAEGSTLGAAFGVHRALDAIGATLGPIVAFTVLALAANAFDAVFVVSLAFAVMGVITLLLFVRDPPELGRDGADGPVSVAKAFGLLRSPRLLPVIAASVVLSLTTVSDGFIYLVLQRRQPIELQAMPLLFAGTSAFYFLTAVPFGVAADRFGRRAVFLSGYALLLLTYGLVLAPVNATIQVAGVMMLLGSYYGATDGVIAALASSALPPHLRGTGLSLVTTMTGSARAVSSLVFGYLWSVWPERTVMLVFAVGLMTAIIVASRVLARKVEPPS